MAETKDKILIVESDKEAADKLKLELEQLNYIVLVALSGKSGLEMVASHCPQLVILEMKLSDFDGNAFIRCVRVWSSLPIIVLSRFGTEKEKAATLDYGADDYLMKPIGSIELAARIRAAFRHTLTVSQRDQIAVERCFKVRELTVDYLSHKVLVDGKDKHLTPNEFRILSCLAKHPGEVLTYRRIAHELWGPSAATDNKILRVHMSNIRKKIETDPLNPTFLLTEAGVGYILADK